jgi:hypothetical protein
MHGGRTKQPTPRQLRNRRYQQRLRAGRFVQEVELGAYDIDQLEAAELLPRRDVHEPQQIEQAIKALIAAARLLPKKF